MKTNAFQTIKKLGRIAVVCVLSNGQIVCDGGSGDGAGDGSKSGGSGSGHGTVYLSSTGSGSGKGTMGDPVATLAGAVALAKSYDTAEIRIAAGTYTVDDAVERLDVDEAGIVVPDGVSIYGGYSASDWNERDPDTHETVVKGSSTGMRAISVTPTGFFNTMPTPARILYWMV